MVFSRDGLFGAWLPLGEVVMGLLVGLFILCEGNCSFLDVVSVLVYRDVAPGVFGYPEFAPSSGGVAVLLSSWFQGTSVSASPMTATG